MLLYEIAHVITQQLRAGTITRFRSGGKLFFQSFIDPEGKGCVTHYIHPFVLRDKCIVSQPLYRQHLDKSILHGPRRKSLAGTIRPLNAKKAPRSDKKAESGSLLLDGPKIAYRAQPFAVFKSTMA